MTRIEAHNILDAAQRGEAVTKALITEALQATGDLARYESLPVKYEVAQWSVAYTSPAWAAPLTRAPAFVVHESDAEGGE